MKTDRVVLNPGLTIGERVWNREAMAEGLAHVPCTMVAKTQETACSMTVDLLSEGEHISSIEFYANGAMNVFIRNETSALPVALIRIRPEDVDLRGPLTELIKQAQKSGGKVSDLAVYRASEALNKAG